MKYLKFVNSPHVAASPDALDSQGSDAAINAGQQPEAAAEPAPDSLSRRRTLRRLKNEARFLRAEESISTNRRASHAARAYERVVCKRYADSPDFFVWSSNRALDLQNFDYLFHHRHRFPEKILTWLEIIASKITHLNDDGSLGYFNKLERNIGWTPYITPLLFTNAENVDKLVRCGLWASSHNSRRCHKPDFCPLCLWNDILKVLVAAFGDSSGAFFKAEAWWLITISWTTNPRNARCSSSDYNPDDNTPPNGDRGYDPYPVVLGLDDYDADLAWLGYTDARLLGMAMQKAVSHLYKRHHIKGYHHKLEGTYRLHPGGANRVNLHCHTVANGQEENGEFIAQTLRQSINGLIRQWQGQLNRRYFVDIRVQRIRTPEHLENAVCYTEKVVPINHMVADAVGQPLAKLPDGTWNPGFIAGLQRSLKQLVDEDIPNIFSGASLEDGLPRLFRRKTSGNIVFNDKGMCIGDEPEWHARARRRHAKKQRQQRAQRKKKKDASLKKKREKARTGKT